MKLLNFRQFNKAVNISIHSYNLYCLSYHFPSCVLQNLGEAEYVVAMFMYMRLLGYPAEKISILTTYNGQKHLIRDVIQQRCAKNPFIGRPHTVCNSSMASKSFVSQILSSLLHPAVLCFQPINHCYCPSVGLSQN